MNLNSERVPPAWHPADIIAAVRKRGTTLQRLSRERGFSVFTMNKAVRQCFPACHDIIAGVVGVPRQTIWPQFYDREGVRLSPRERRRRAIAAELSQARAA
ncbi:helix-turn-helix domain-containing protein [Bosea sp. 2KB_26]|uniref:helix-turn-helix domain-containing protein n=1 Tax=Bosea sp. 2KB_26 TaxID=3237475 RepID=UPI003F92679D